MPDVKRIPDNYPRVSPYLYVDGAKDAIDFYRNVLGATERGRIDGPNGTIGHAELEIGGSVIMLADASPAFGKRSPKSFGGSPVDICLYVEDVDAVHAKALKNGAKETRALQNEFYGDRRGEFEDPFGHRWSIATHVEDVAPEEMAKRAAQLANA